MHQPSTHEVVQSVGIIGQNQLRHADYGFFWSLFFAGHVELESVAVVLLDYHLLATEQKSRIYFAIHAGLALFSGLMNLLITTSRMHTPVSTTGITTITG